MRFPELSACDVDKIPSSPMVPVVTVKGPGERSAGWPPSAQVGCNVGTKILAETGRLWQDLGFDGPEGRFHIHLSQTSVRCGGDDQQLMREADWCVRRRSGA
jgi:hypothetical protein